MDLNLKRADEDLAAAVKRHVRLGGQHAAIAASIAREYAHARYGAQSHQPCGLGRVSFYVAAGLDAIGEVRK